jgi:hypothetical protein
MQTERPNLNAIQSADRATGHLIMPLRLLHQSGKSRSRLLHLPDLRHACEPLNPCLHNTAHRSPGMKGPFTSTHCCNINHNEARDIPRFCAWTGVQSELCLAVARIFRFPRRYVCICARAPKLPALSPTTTSTRVCCLTQYRPLTRPLFSFVYHPMSAQHPVPR